jgi:hypothetical protein
MENICSRCGSKYAELNKLGFDAGHGNLYCGIHCLPQKDAKMLGIVWGSHAHRGLYIGKYPPLGGGKYQPMSFGEKI